MWTSATINVSDADPAASPGVATPIAYQSVVGRDPIASRESRFDPFTGVNLLFPETGSFTGNAGSIVVQQSLHAAGLLHADDPESVLRLCRRRGHHRAHAFHTKGAQIVA